MKFDAELLIPDESLSIDEGAIVGMGWQSSKDEGSFSRAILDALAEEYGFSLKTPFKDYPDDIKDIIINGTKGHSVKVKYKGQRGEGVYDVAFEGLIKNMERRYRETYSDNTKQQYEEFMRIRPCSACHGQRLKPSSLAVTIADKNIYEITNMSIIKLQEFLENMKLSERQLFIGAEILKEIKARIKFLVDVGLDYLALSRATGTLSGGEAEYPHVPYSGGASRRGGQRRGADHGHRGRGRQLPADAAVDLAARGQRPEPAESPLPDAPLLFGRRGDRPRQDHLQLDGRGVPEKGHPHRRGEHGQRGVLVERFQQGALHEPFEPPPEDEVHHGRVGHEIHPQDTLQPCLQTAAGPQIFDFGDQFDGGLQLPVVFRHELQETRRMPAHGVCPQPLQERRESGVALLP